jgi:hypothetical protein
MSCGGCSTWWPGCAGHVPDHTTVARFRQAHALLRRQLFAQVLEIGAVAGLAHVGVVALDGIKPAANASKDAPAEPIALERYRFPRRLGLMVYPSLRATSAGAKMIEQLGDHPRYGHRCL